MKTKILQSTNNQELSLTSRENRQSLTSDFRSIFWQQWEQHYDFLYCCCVKWIGNVFDAEDVLSQAMLKSWEKSQDERYTITNFKSWLMRLTRNLCMDFYRQRARGPKQVEDLEQITGDSGLMYKDEYTTVEKNESTLIIRQAIDKLPPKLRETFELYFYQEISYLEIAQRLNISYDNVCKRLSQARKILQADLQAYFREK